MSKNSDICHKKKIIQKQIDTSINREYKKRGIAEDSSAYAPNYFYKLSLLICFKKISQIKIIPSRKQDNYKLNNVTIIN